MYHVGDKVYLNQKENDELLNGELFLTRTVYVDSVDDVPVEYCYEAIIGRDIELI